jgi:geranyl-CoA carboxylase alpha subunit
MDKRILEGPDGRRWQLSATKGAEQTVTIQQADAEEPCSATMQLLPTPTGDWLVLQDGIVRPVRVTIERDRLWLSQSGVADPLATTTRWQRIETRRGKAAQAEGAVRSPMTGRVVLVPVQVGSLVDKGDVLIVVEAMKMEHALKAPKAGVVASIAATVGQLVEGGVELVVLSEPTATAGGVS